MRFSILIPVYNVEKYLNAAVQSVLSQNFKSYEIILVNDGSTDGSLNICLDYRNKYPDIVTVIDKNNQGLISARRVAIKAAKGDYCIFLDSDDVLLGNSMETINNMLMTSNNPDILIHNVMYINNDGTEGKKRSPIFKNGTLFDETGKNAVYLQMISNTYLNPIWIKVIKRELIQNDLTDYSKYYGNDYGEDILQSLYPITEAKTIMYIDDVLYGYRMSDTSMIRKYSKDSMDKRFNEAVQNTVKDYMKKWGMLSEENINIYLAKNYKTMMDSLVNFVLMDKKSYREIKKYSKEFVIKYPDIKRMHKCASLSYSHRIQLFLFGNNCILCLCLIQKLLRAFI